MSDVFVYLLERFVYRNVNPSLGFVDTVRTSLSNNVPDKEHPYSETMSPSAQ